MLHKATIIRLRMDPVSDFMASIFETDELVQAIGEQNGPPLYYFRCDLCVFYALTRGCTSCLVRYLSTDVGSLLSCPIGGVGQDSSVSMGNMPGMVAHTCNPSLWKAEAGG